MYLRHLVIPVLMTLPVPSFAAELYVAPGGSDATGDGTINNPWQTPQKAVDEALPGDVILLRQGVYRPEAGKLSLINFQSGGQAGARITLKAYPGETAELKGTLDYGDPAQWDCTATCFTPLATEPNIVVQGDTDTTLEPKSSMPQEEGDY
jgi:hypothetical protein